jgi:hypothetical protein
MAVQIAPDDDSPFSSGALTANQSGQLSDAQSRQWNQIAKRRRP